METATIEFMALSHLLSIICLLLSAIYANSKTLITLFFLLNHNVYISCRLWLYGFPISTI